MNEEAPQEWRRSPTESKNTRKNGGAKLSLAFFGYLLKADRLFWAMQKSNR